MPDFNDIPTGLRVPSQIPLDIKEYFATLADMLDLGTNNNKAFTYYKGFRAFCVENNNIYVWKEALPELGAGLLPSNFTYPNGTECFGVDYSNAEYNFFLKPETLDIVSIGSGVPIYKGYNVGMNRHEIMSATSNSILITQNGNEVNFEIPAENRGIQYLYVNDLYQPTYQEWLSENASQNGGTPIAGFVFRGKGTLAQPFTDTIVYTLNAPLTPPIITANTAIQNALDGDTVYSYVGNLTRLNPQRKGQKITIQDNTTFYSFSGDFEYTGLNLKIEGYVGCTTAGYLIDMDNSLNITTPSTINIEVSKDKRLEIFGKGFKNNGTTTATNNFINYNQIILSGEGTISFKGNDINKYLLNSDKDSVGNTTIGFNNDGSWQFEVRCYLESEFQGLVALGGVSRIYSFGGTFQTGTVFTDVDINLKAFNLKGGTLRLIRNSTIVYYGSNITSRLKLFTLELTNGFTPTLEKSNCLMAGNCTTLYSKENNNTANLNIVNSGGYETNCINIFDSTNLWSVNFRDNYFSSGNIDPTKADLTQGNSISSVNYFGNLIVESLVKYPYRRDGGSNTVGNLFLPKGSRFLNQNGSMIESEWYVDIML